MTIIEKQNNFLPPENDYSIVVKTIINRALNKISNLKFNSKIDNITNIISLVSTIVYSSVHDGVDFNLSPHSICYVTCSLLHQVLKLTTSDPSDIIFNVEIYYSEIITNAIKNREEIIEIVNLTYNKLEKNSNTTPRETGSDQFKIAEHYSCSHNSIYIIASIEVLDLVKNNPTIDDDSLIEKCVNKLFSLGCDIYVISAIVGVTIPLIRNNIGSKLSIKENEYLALISGCAANINVLKSDNSKHFIVRSVHKKIEKNGKFISALFIVLTVGKLFRVF